MRGKDEEAAAHFSGAGNKGRRRRERATSLFFFFRFGASAATPSGFFYAVSAELHTVNRLRRKMKVAMPYKKGRRGEGNANVARLY